ncbi:protein saal1 [Sitophilus oryzae]|uniref:Protein saal1 n=1 Tax=Sitophilus oryzae TaxID=7048 RepID=A0A6J2XUY9_SITOR|nr:protein saal1 [Sitophilus oryzae]
MAGSNVNSTDLDQDTREKLKGDCIGDTLYSESFVLKTLLKLSNVDWNEELEQDLCFLWDMTLEKEVCQYLFQLNYPALACSVISQHTEERLLEIIVGILANILMADCDRKIDDSEIQIVLNSLNFSDPTILTQVMRFIESIAYYVPEKITLIGEEELAKIQFILKNSENNLLLIQTFQTLIKLTDNFKLGENFVTAELYKTSVIGFDTLINMESDDFEIDTEETSMVLKLFLHLLTNICFYVDKYNHDNEISTCLNNSSKIYIIIHKILKYFSHENNLFPLSMNFKEYIGSFLTFFTTRDISITSYLKFNTFSKDFSSICKIINLLYKCKDEVEESFDLVLEFLAYFICSIDKHTILTELQKIEYKRGIVVLNCLKESLKTSSFDISENLKYFFLYFK